VTLRSLQVLASLVACLCLLSCNESPSEVGSDLSPGIDSLFTLSSIDVPSLIASTETVEAQRPIFNSTFFFLGKSAQAEARSFIEFINYPSLGNSSDWSVLSSELLLHPLDYRFGDSTNTSFGFDVHELDRLWDPSITWDSVWNAADVSTYYSPASPKICSFRGQITNTDTVVALPFDVAFTKQMLIRGADSTLRGQLFGLVVLPTVSSHVRLFRNLQTGNQIMRLRVVIQHRDSSEPDTTLLESAVACFVKTPKAAAGTLFTQGAAQHRLAVDLSVAAIPRNAVILDATLQLTANSAASLSGSLGPDDVLRATFLPPGASAAVIYQARKDDASQQFNFRNLAGSLQAILRSGDSVGRFLVIPDDFREQFRVNLTGFHPIDAPIQLRPRLSVVYAIPRLNP
jgi:hypothetical protein